MGNPRTFAVKSATAAAAPPRHGRMRAGGIVPLISLARDGAPPAQQSSLLALAAFQIPLARDCVFPIPALVREGIAELVRKGAIPLMVALALGISDSEVKKNAI